MQIKQLFVIGLMGLLVGFNTQAQTLFTYGGHPVSRNEFLNSYKKNNTQNRISIPKYVQLYALFKMKVQQAKDMKMDTTQKVINELNRYKEKLANSELVDQTVTKRLVKEVYNRMKTDVKVAHILIAVQPHADSAQALKTIDSLYKVLKNKKADFATLSKQYSDDHTTSDNGGEVGYITALQTPYHFESAAYNTAVGQISKPIRTIYGYHIIKVKARRPDPGKVKVAQILISSPEYESKAYQQNAKKLAYEIEKELKKGANFSSLVKKYSDDKFTKNNGGVMKPFSIGEYVPQFEKAAFALKQPGAISKPIKTKFGYHIIKLIKHIPLKPFDSIKADLTLKVKQSPREKEAKEAYRNAVKQKYHFKGYPNNRTKMITLLAKDTGRNLNPKKYPNLTQPLFKVEGKSFTQNDFLSYAHKLTNGHYVGQKKQALNDLYTNYENHVIAKLQQEKLFHNNPKYQKLIKEYKEGILLFDLMNKEVWNKASQDTSGLKVFYKNHKEKYQWQPGFQGTILQCKEKKPLEQLRGKVKQGLSVDKALSEIKDEYGGHSGIIPSSGRFAFSKIPLSAKFMKSHQISKIYNNPNTGSAGNIKDYKTSNVVSPKDNSLYEMVFVQKLYPNPEPKSLADARGFVMADYQNYLKQQWEKELRKKYPLKINNKVLHKLEKLQH